MPPFDVLVTGSSGHLGTALMLALPSLGFNPLGIDILPSPTTHRLGSISDRDFVGSALQSQPIRHVLHAATLHKPHIDSHTMRQFIDTNVVGTLVLLEEAAKKSSSATPVDSFVFFSTTSAFGNALSPAPGTPAAWIDEEVQPLAKNIYGVTKVAAEDMCVLVQRSSSLPVVILRTSRFFPEQDDDEDRRAALPDDNLKLLELAYRRVDLADIVHAAHAAMLRARSLGLARYIISAPTPFANDPETLALLDSDPARAFHRVAPGLDKLFEDKGWSFLARLDRVYDSAKAVAELGWQPKYTFAYAVEQLSKGKEFRSELARKVGRKGYHAVSTGVYTQRSFSSSDSGSERRGSFTNGHGHQC